MGRCRRLCGSMQLTHTAPQSLDNAELASLYQRGLREVRDLVVLSNQEVLDLRDGCVA